MNEYMVVYTDGNGEQFSETYPANSLTEFKQKVKDYSDRGYEFAIYQIVPVCTDWEEQWFGDALKKYYG